MRPGVDVITLSQPPPRSAPTYTGAWFVVGETAIGPVVPVEVNSMKQYEDTFGSRAGGTMLYDSVDAFFREGGSRVWVSAIPTTPSMRTAKVDRGNGSEPTSAEAGEELQEAPTSSSTRAEWDEYASSLGIDPTQYDTKQELMDAVAPPTATVAAATPTQITAALDRFLDTLGPGQVSVPGSSDATVQTALLQHAADNNRVALIDGAELGTAAQNEAKAASLHANGRYAALFGPWAIYPGIAAGTERHIPYSAIEAGIIARNDSTGNANIAAAGVQGRSNLATGVTVSYTDAEYEAMNEAGFDAAKIVHGEVQTYGYRSLADPATPDGLNWQSFGWSRLNMEIAAQAEAIGERYVFSQLDGRGLTIGQFGSELRAMLQQFYLDGALFGETPADAFDVDVGPQVNTIETIAAGELHAVMRVRMSPFAEWVVIEIVKVVTTESVAVAA